MPRAGSGPRTGAPSTVTSPFVGSTNPARMCRSVDLPHPEGPTIETNSPRRASRSSPSIAVTLARRVSKTLRTPRAAIFGAGETGSAARGEQTVDDMV